MVSALTGSAISVVYLCSLKEKDVPVCLEKSRTTLSGHARLNRIEEKRSNFQALAPHGRKWSDDYYADASSGVDQLVLGLASQIIGTYRGCS